LPSLSIVAAKPRTKRRTLARVGSSPPIAY